MFKDLNSLLRTLFLGGVVLIGGWWTWFLRGELGEQERALAERDGEIAKLASRVESRDQQIRDLGLDLQERDAEIRRLDEAVLEREERIRELDAALELLKVDHRVAEIEVLSQGSKPGSDEVRTFVRFTELDGEGEPIGEPLEATVEGKTLYVETLVVKFEDDFVEGGDSLKGTSICLFRRLFGEDQSPSGGVPIDAVGVQPLVYGGDDVPPDERQERGRLWSRFWDYANDPELARSRGVRAVHGEAPFIELRPGKSYRVELRASGGLTIRAID